MLIFQYGFIDAAFSYTYELFTLQPGNISHLKLSVILGLDPILAYYFYDDQLQ